MGSVAREQGDESASLVGAVAWEQVSYSEGSASLVGAIAWEQALYSGGATSLVGAVAYEYLPDSCECLCEFTLLSIRFLP